MTTTVRLGIIGAGAMARHHIRTMLGRADTEIVALCEPSEAAVAAAEVEFTARDAAVPPNEPDWQRFIERFAPAGLDPAIVGPTAPSAQGPCTRPNAARRQTKPVLPQG